MPTGSKNKRSGPAAQKKGQSKQAKTGNSSPEKANKSKENGVNRRSPGQDEVEASVVTNRTSASAIEERSSVSINGGGTNELGRGGAESQGR